MTGPTGFIGSTRSPTDRDNPVNPDFTLGPLPQDQQPFFRQLHDAAQLNQPSIQAFSEAIRAVANGYEDRFLMGEVDGDNDDAVKVSQTFTMPGRLHATYNFDLLEWAGLNVEEMKHAIARAAEAFNGSPSRTMMCRDPRRAS